MKATWILILPAAWLWACGGGNQPAQDSPPAPPAEQAAPYDPQTNKGVGEIKEVTLTNPLDEAMVSRGQAITDMKCSACHSMAENRIVGPGWKGVTTRRTPEWIMNMITNVDVMLEKDEAAQKMLEECLVRMPNQGLSVGDARDVLEYMRKLDAQ